MNRSTAIRAGQIMGTLNGLQVMGLDTAKQVFQLFTVDMHSGEIVQRRLMRAKVLTYFAKREPMLIAMEACGAAHHWARELQALGHQVKLLPAREVRRYVTGNKTDATDAHGIWNAAQDPKVRAVAVKTIEQQAVLTLHRLRQQLQKISTMQSNALRGLLGEFGIVFGTGKNVLLKEIAQGLAQAEQIVPASVVQSMQESVQRIRAMELEIIAIDHRLAQLLRANEDMVRVSAIPGVGLLTATACIATMGQANTFKSGHELCAWLGLVPRQTGTGGKVRLGGISKRGDTCLRTLLVNGARSVFSAHKRALKAGKPTDAWLTALAQRRPANVVVVAQAAKMARQIWAVTAHKTPYERTHQSMAPQGHSVMQAA